MKIYAKDFCQIVQGQWLAKEPSLDGVLNGVSIDSRDPEDFSQKVFFAIKGQRRDGHDFVWDVLKKDIGVLVVCSDFAKRFSSRLLEAQCNQSFLVCSVKDTLVALHRLAQHWRQQNKWKVIGITGSAGKTSTKHFCQLLLEQHFKVKSSPKSFNNHYGVPLAILSASEDLDFFIQEIGMNQKGEIAFLSQLVQPDIAVVLQVGSSHIGLLGSKEEIAKEKEQIYHHTSRDAVLVFNRDNVYTQSMLEKIKKLMPTKTILSFSSQDASADVFLSLKEVLEDSLVLTGHIEKETASNIKVNIVGSAHLSNLSAAGAVAMAAGMKPDQIWQALPACKLPPGRNQWVNLKCGARVLFDAYNASAESVMALLDHFLSFIIQGKRILILGDFLEMGSYLEPFHQHLADRLYRYQQESDSQQQLHRIWFIGSQAELFGQSMAKAGWLKQNIVCGEEVKQHWNKKVNELKQNATHFVPVYLSNSDDLYLADKILSMLDPSFVLALKASRKMQMEKILDRWQPVDFHAL